MNSTTFLPSSRRNSKIDGNQVNFGTIDFQPHPPTLAPVFANLDQEMDLISGVSTSRWVSRLDPPLRSRKFGSVSRINRNHGDFKNIDGLIQRGKLAGQHEADEKQMKHNQRTQ
jgi:hypothetical protein